MTWLLSGEEVGEFDIPGPPRPKQRARRSKEGHWYTPKATVEYESAVAWNAQAAGIRLDKGSKYAVEVHLYMTARRARTDLDNIFKAIADGLNQLPNFDDCQIREQAVRSIDITDPRDEKAVVRITRRDA